MQEGAPAVGSSAIFGCGGQGIGRRFCKRRLQEWRFPNAVDKAAGKAGRPVLQLPETRRQGDAADLVREVASWHGRPLNCVALSRRLGIARHRVAAEVERLRRDRLVLLLPAVEEDIGRGGVQAPVLYLRASCELLRAAGLSDQLLFQGAVIEHVIGREELRCPSSRYGHASTPGTTHAALVLTTPRARVGFQFPAEPVPSKRRWTGLMKRIRAGSLEFGYVLYPGRRVFFSYRRLVAVPVGDFLDGYAAWMEAAEDASSRRAHELAAVCNRFILDPAWR
jgi:hypothetical protein